MAHAFSKTGAFVHESRMGAVKGNDRARWVKQEAREDWEIFKEQEANAVAGIS